MIKTYKYKYPGDYVVQVIKKRPDGSEWIEFVSFKKHTLSTDDPDIQKAVEKLIEKDRKLDIQARIFFTKDEFDETVTPDKVFIEDGKGGTIHRSVLLEAYDFAVKKGFKGKEKVVAEINEPGSRVVQGTNTGDKK